MTAAAFRATVHGIRTVPSRKVLQIVVETAIEELPHVAQIAEHGAWLAIARLQEPATHDAGQEGRGSATAPAPPLQPEPAKSYCVAEAMGGPRCKGRCEVPKDCGGIPEAPIKRERKSWDSMSPAQQAAIRCNDPLFRAFLEWSFKVEMKGAESAADFVRRFCEVGSRRDIQAGNKGWRTLEREFDKWRVAERAGVI